MWISGQGIKKCATVKPHNIRDMIKEMKQAKMKLKAFMSRFITLPISSTSSAASGSTNGPRAPKKRGSTQWIEHSIKRRDELDCNIAKMFYTGGLSFNLTRNPWYTKAFKFVANYSITGYKPPN